MEKTLKHVAFIMDGNGRWAKKRGLPRHLGHKAGCDVVNDIYDACREKGILAMSLYAFSTENWNRPKDEIDHLFEYLDLFFKRNIKKMIRDECRLIVSGDISRLPLKTQKTIAECKELTKGLNKFTFNICLNYGGKDEIVRASKKIAEEYKNGNILLDDINEESFDNYLYTKDLPPVDLLIRTSGEQRLSNYLLWQLAYAEFIFTPTYWPDFNKEELYKCFDEFYSRNRRFGGIVEDGETK